MILENPIKDLIINYFRTKPVIKVYLFGSYARGQAENSSDIDILVDLDYSKKIGLQFVQMKLDLEKILNLKVDLVSSSGLSKYLKPVIDKEKQIVYERQFR